MEELHYGGIESLSTSLWKPMLMTCGKIDFTIKVWDYLQFTLVLSKNYIKQVSSVSLHPTGMYSVAAFLDHVEFQMVQLDDLVPLKTFPIRGCNRTSFSESGNLFALAKLGAIDVYCSIMFEKCYSCQGHMGTVSVDYILSLSLYLLSIIFNLMNINAVIILFKYLLL